MEKSPIEISLRPTYFRSKKKHLIFALLQVPNIVAKYGLDHLFTLLKDFIMVSQFWISKGTKRNQNYFRVGLFEFFTIYYVCCRLILEADDQAIHH